MIILTNNNVYDIDNNLITVLLGVRGLAFSECLLGDFAVPRIFIFADAGSEHSSFIVLLSYFLFLLKRGHLFSQTGYQPRK